MKIRLKRTRYILLAVIVVIGIGFGARMLIQQKKTALAAAPRFQIRPLAVQTARSYRGTWEHVRDYLALAEPVQTATLSARLTTTVQSLLVKEGDRAEAGQLLMTLDDREIKETMASVQAQIDQVRAEQAANDATVQSLAGSLDYWTREADRIAHLQAGGAATVSEAEAARERVNEITGRLESTRQKSRALEYQAASLKRRLAEIQTRLSYCSIVSPFDGVVSERHVDPGDLAAPGKALLTVEDHRRLKLAFDIPQQDVPQVRTGMSVSYTTPGGTVRQASVHTLYPSLNHARMLRAEAVLTGESAEELVGRAYIPLSLVLKRKESVTFVPAAAVTESPKGQSHVFVVRDGRLDAIPVRLIGQQNDQAAVEGIEPGQQVVISTFLGWSVLNSGLPVEVRQ